MLARSTPLLRLQTISQQFSTDVSFTQHSCLLKMQLTRPAALNALSLPMILSMRQQLSLHLPQSKVLWIEGTGGKAFCAGGDVKGLFIDNIPFEKQLSFFEQEFTMDYHLSQSKCLQIANWDGIVMGGGFGISAFAPYRIATQNTVFAMPQNKIGFFTDVAASYVLARLRNNIGYYLGMTGKRLKGEDVYIAGLANYFITTKNIPTVLQSLQNELPTSDNIKNTIETILDKYHQQPSKLYLDKEEEIYEVFKGKSAKEVWFRVCCTENEVSQDVKPMMQQLNPLSMAVTHKLIQLAKKRTVRECFLQDFQVCAHFLRGKDFKEGVKCALIEKGKVPKWSYNSISEVSDEIIESMLAKDPNVPQLNI